MINLIPLEGKKSAKREYMLRLGATFCFLFGFVTLLLAAAHIPTYVLIQAQISTIEADAGRGTDKVEAIKQADEEVRKIGVVIAQLKKTHDTLHKSDVVTEIERHISDTIVLKNFSIDITGQKTDMIQVQGTATTREALAQFKSALEASPLFSKAEVPISDLVRDTDLPFTVTLQLETQQKI